MQDEGFNDIHNTINDDIHDDEGLQTYGSLDHVSTNTALTACIFLGTISLL